MSDYISGNINFAGLGNGTDFNSLIEGLLKIEKRRVTSLESWKQSWQDKVDQFDELNTQMVTLSSTLKSLDTLNEFMAKNVSSSNTTILTATANADAQEASHNVIVGNLATNDVLVTTSGVSSLSSSVTSTNTNFTYSYAGTSYTLSNISAGTDLQTLVNIINTHPDSQGNIRASTVFDGSVYHLQLTGRDLGADNQVIISNTGSLVFAAGDFNETQGASNAKIRVDGFPDDGSWIERDSNAVSDVIEGITLNLKEASPGTTVSIGVTTDTEKIKENIRTVVDQINEVRTKIMAMTKVDTSQGDDKVKGSILTGNYGVDMISQNLKNITASKGVGFEYYDPDTGSGDFYTSLGQIGITTDTDEGSPTYGLLVIEETTDDPDKQKFTLNYALEHNPEEVARLFAVDKEGISRSSDFSFNSQLDNTEAGSYDVVIVTSAAGISSATIGGEECRVSGWQITCTTGDPKGLVLDVNNQTANSTFTGVVDIKLGKAGEMVNELAELTKPYNHATHDGGPLAILKENYGDIMEGIDKKIERENTRIARMEYRLKNQYARLDALLGQYNQQQQALASQLTQLSQ